MPQTRAGLRCQASNSGIGLRHSHDNPPSARQFFVRDFRDEVQVEAKTHALLTGHLVEEVHHISAKALLGSTALFQIKRARRIYLQISRIAHDRAKRALKLERSLTYLRHGESGHVIGHRPSMAEPALACPVAQIPAANRTGHRPARPVTLILAVNADP